MITDDILCTHCRFFDRQSEYLNTIFCELWYTTMTIRGYHKRTGFTCPIYTTAVLSGTFDFRRRVE